MKTKTLTPLLPRARTLLVLLLCCWYQSYGQLPNNWLIQRNANGTPLEFGRLEITNSGTNVSTLPPGTFNDRLGNPITDAVAFNSYYSTTGSLYFTVVYSASQKVYFYDANRQLIETCSGSLPTLGYGGNSTEIIIVPVPGSCENLFHVWVGTTLHVFDHSTNEISQGYTGGISIYPLDEINFDVSGHASGCYASYSPIEVYVPNSEYYYIYYIGSGSVGGNGNYRLYRAKVPFFCESFAGCESKYFNIDDFEITSRRFHNGTTNLTKSKFTGGTLIPNFIGSIVSELQISKDGTRLLFNTNYDIYIADLSTLTNTNLEVWNFPIPQRLSGLPYQVSGLDFDATGDNVYFTIFDECTPLLSDALYKIDVNAATVTAVPGTADNSRSQVRRGIDDNVYVLNSTNINQIDPAGVITNISLPTGNPELSAPIFPGCTIPCGTSTFGLYMIPDYPKGIVDANFVTGPVIIERNISVCFGGDVNTGADHGNCMEVLGNNIKWYENNVLIGENDVSFYWGYADRDRVVDAVWKTPYSCANNTFTTRYTITVPQPVTEDRSIYVCYGGDLTLAAPTQSGMTYIGMYDESYAPFPIYNTDIDIILTGITASREVIFAYGDHNDCVEKFIRYTILVSPPPVTEQKVHYVCPGGVVNIDFAAICTGTVSTDINGHLSIGNPFAGDPDIAFHPGTGISITFHGGYKEVSLYCFQFHTYTDPETGIIHAIMCLEKTIVIKIYDQITAVPSAGTKTLCIPEKVNLDRGLVMDNNILFTVDPVTMPGFILPDCDWYDAANNPITGVIDPAVISTIYHRCVDQYGCVTSTPIHFVNLPSATQTINHTVNCGETFNPGSIPTACSNVVWYTSKVKAPENLFNSLTIPITQNTTLHGFGIDANGNCCYVELILNTQPVTVHYMGLCLPNEGFAITNIICPNGIVTVNGLPAVLPYTVNAIGNYTMVCDDGSGCPKRYVYHFGEAGCNNTFAFCYEPNMPLPIPPGCINPNWVPGYPTGPGIYTLSCAGAVYQYILQDCPDMRGENPAETDVMVYPQPAQSLLNIRINATPQSPAAGMPQGNALWKFKVYDLTGRLLLEEDRREVPGQTYSLDVSRIKGTAQALILVVQDEAAQIIFHKPVLFYPQ